MKYITHNRFKKLAACGEAVNIPYGTEMETAGDFIITTEGKPICYATSEAAKMHFARNDYGQGLERGKLTWAIAYSQRVRTGPNGRQQRFTEEEIELLERKWAHFLRQDVEVILFNEDFFAAAVPELSNKQKTDPETVTLDKFLTEQTAATTTAATTTTTTAAEE